MTNGEIKRFALELAKVGEEKEVIEILKKAGYWDNDSDWREYGDNPQNFSIIGNQQESAANALVEKLINSVDAVLMRECLKRGLDPSSPQAPRNIAKAQQEFFNIYNGKLSSLDSRERTEIAKNIYLVSTGKKNNLSFSIIDKGEGQSPQQIPKTILSLTKSNKNKIKFVQGKYGMGGSGVLRFCGNKNRVLLVISKRNHEISAGIDEKIYSEDKTRHLWGVTVIRRENPKAAEKNTHYTYLAPEGKILSFDADELPLLPHSLPYQCPEVLHSPLRSGTFIKLYEYDIGPGLKSLTLFDLYYRLALLIPDIALPIRIVEGREGFKASSYEKTLAGLSVRLIEDKKDNLEPDFPSTGKITVDNQELSYAIYVFKINKKATYAKKSEGIVFIVNGQAHGFIPEYFFKRKTVRMSYLSSSILIIIDCSKIDRREQEDLFMTSRDRIADTPMRHSIEQTLEEIIRHHPGLRNLQNRRRKEMIQNKIQDAKPLADILSDVINKSPTLSQILSSGNRISHPFDKRGVAGQEGRFEGKEFPSYFSLSKRCKSRPFPIDQKYFRVQYETDAVNDYFNRDKEPGEITLKCNDEIVPCDTPILWNGLATLTIVPRNIKEDIKIGDKLSFETRVTDCMQINPFIDNFSICITEGKKANGSTHDKSKSDESAKNRQKPLALDVPKSIPIEKEDWNKEEYREFNFNEHSALRVRNAGEEDKYDFYINMDNIYLRSEMKNNNKIDPRIMETRYECGMMLLGMSILKFNKSQEQNGDDTDEDKLSIEMMVSQFTDAVAPFLLPMVAYLGGLELED